jgi:hypothetical protein
VGFAGIERHRWLTDRRRDAAAHSATSSVAIDSAGKRRSARGPATVRDLESVVARHSDGTVDVLHRGPVEGAVDSAVLERLYWDEISRVTLGAARFSRGAIRVGGIWPVLFRFGPPVDGRRVIAGGLFARRAGGSIAWAADGEQVSVAVEGFLPLLRGRLWRVEERFHASIGRRFLQRVEREASR